MKQGEQLSMQMLAPSELIPIVAQVIDMPKIDSLVWQVQPVSGVGGGEAAGAIGLFRLSGSAEIGGESHPWSVVLKVFKGADTSAVGRDTIQDPAAWNYWKREILAYSSGILSELGDNLIAPRFYGVTEHPNNEWYLWLEDIEETVKTWRIERHGLAARHLGQFNGAYLTSRVLPDEQPWLYRGRTKEWVRQAEPMFEGLLQYAASTSGRRWLSEHSVERMQRLMLNYPSLLALLDRLPVCLCHHDAFRRNLLARDSSQQEVQTVAIDWSMLGYGGVGEEIGITAAIALSWLEVAGAEAREMDKAIFESYVAGLQDVGWQGDVRLARFGYTTTASLAIGLSWATFMGVGAFSSAEGTQFIETAIGYKQAEILAQWAIIQPFLLDLGDEALQLMDELE